MMRTKLILHGDWATGDQRVDLELPADNIHLANFEGPLLKSELENKRAIKAGPNIYNKYLPTDEYDFIFSLANNHIMDYGLHGLKNTIDKFKQEGIGYTGAGLNETEARFPYILVLDNNVSVGIISCCEAQYGIAQLGKAGVAEMDSWLFKVIAELKMQVDYVIVSIHAGSENSPWPIPKHTALYRSYIDAGATIIHGHHSHLPQGWEQYRSGYIFYGLGNFAVAPHMWKNMKNALWSLGVEIEFDRHSYNVNPFTFDIIECSGRIRVKRSSSENFRKHMHYIAICNKPLNDVILLNALWQEVSIELFEKWGQSALLPSKSRMLIRRRKRIFKLMTALRSIIKGKQASCSFSAEDCLRIYHLFSCSSHREMYITALGLKTGEINDLRSDKSRELIRLLCQGE